MKYNYKGKDYVIPDEVIDNYMESLDISLAEACEMWLEDEGKVELSEETKKAISVSGKIDVGVDHKPRKKTTREKKVNPDKKAIISAILSGLTENIETNGEIIVRNDEKYLDFKVNGVEYTVNLVSHRPKKS